MDLVFSNELILENIFSYLSTPDLLLRVNRTNSKWNQVSRQFVQRNRAIFINNNNIMSYVDMISDGGTEHKIIHLSLRYDYHPKLTEKDAVKIITTFLEIGDNVRELDLKSQNRELDTDFISFESFSQNEMDIFRCLLHNCKNMKKLSISIPSTPEIFRDPITLLYLPELQILTHLTSLKLKTSFSFSSVLFSFLRIAPNIQELNLQKNLSVEELLEIETLFPSVIAKIAACGISPDKQTSEFFTSRNLRTIRSLKFEMDNLEEIFYDKILTRYANQFDNLELDLGDILHINGLVIFGPEAGLHLTLPVMRNLQTLKLNYGSVFFPEPKIGFCTFWDCHEDEREFPMLVNFQVYFNFPDTQLLIKQNWNMTIAFIVESIFPNKICHAIFPSVKEFHINSASLWDFVKKMEPNLRWRLLDIVKNYFPNLSLKLLFIEAP